MMNIGLFPEGLLIPSIDEIQTDIEADARERFGSNFPLGDDTFAGFIIGALSERLDVLGQSVEAVFSAGDPDKATGIPQRQLGLVTGTFAPDPAPSRVVETLCGDPGTVIPPSSTVRTPDTLQTFSTLDSTTLVAVATWQPDTAYNVGDPSNEIPGDRVTNASMIFECSVSGVSSHASPPSTTDFDIVDGTLHWTYVGQGTAAFDVVMNSSALGPVEAIARGLTDITSEIAGWNTATNLRDAELGVAEMSDEDFRVFRDKEAQGEGTGTPDSVEAKAANLTGVTASTCFFNPNDLPDSDGLDGHCMELLIQGGLDSDIAQMLFDNVAGGIGTRGNTSAVATDAEGKTHVMRFSRPVPKPIYVDITLTKDPELYAGDSSVQRAIALLTMVLGIGSRAVASKISAQVFVVVAGVADIPRSGSLGGVLISLSPSPTSDATILVGTREIATYDVTRVTVHSSDAV